MVANSDISGGGGVFIKQCTELGSKDISDFSFTIHKRRGVGRMRHKPFDMNPKFILPL